MLYQLKYLTKSVTVTLLISILTHVFTKQPLPMDKLHTSTLTHYSQTQVAEQLNIKNSDSFCYYDAIYYKIVFAQISN